MVVVKIRGLSVILADFERLCMTVVAEKGCG